MYKPVRHSIAVCMVGLLSVAQTVPLNSRALAEPRDEKISVGAVLKKSYIDLFEYAEELHFTAAELNSARDGLKRARETCVSSFKEKSKQYDKEIDQAQEQLRGKGANLTESDRHGLHCKIQNLRALKSQTQVLATHAIPTAYENRKAKLDLLEQWPAKYKEISKQLEDGTFRRRHWGDVEDIGFREIERDQEKDIKTGQDAIREMKTSGLMPKELDNAAIVDYVTQVARRVACVFRAKDSTNSDRKYPLIPNERIQ